MSGTRGHQHAAAISTERTISQCERASKLVKCPPQQLQTDQAQHLPVQASAPKEQLTHKVAQVGEPHHPQGLHACGPPLDEGSHHVGNVAGEQAGAVDDTHGQANREAVRAKQQVEDARVLVARLKGDLCVSRREGTTAMDTGQQGEGSRGNLDPTSRQARTKWKAVSWQGVWQPDGPGSQTGSTRGTAPSSLKAQRLPHGKRCILALTLLSGNHGEQQQDTQGLTCPAAIMQVAKPKPMKAPAMMPSTTSLRKELRCLAWPPSAMWS